MKDEVGAEYSGDGSRRAHTRQDGGWAGEYLCPSGSDTSEEIKQKKADMTKAILNLIAKDEQVHHVPDNVHPRSMHEH
jgi:hypothetical protein